jgi:U1 small nuclear ribonucleoprotein
MTQFLPPNLLALFAPRDPIPYLPPPDKLPHEKKNVHNYVGVATFIPQNFENPEDTPPPTRVETKEERLERKRREKEEQVAYKLEQEIALWDPHSAPSATSDPFKTLFVSRINFYTSESKLRREFEQYGPIKSIKMITDKTGKPRGYCFIEFEQEKDMHCKYESSRHSKVRTHSGLFFRESQRFLTCI